jgi:hypothetical protein
MYPWVSGPAAFSSQVLRKVFLRDFRLCRFRAVYKHCPFKKIFQVYASKIIELETDKTECLDEESRLLSILQPEGMTVFAQAFELFPRS